LQIDANNKYTLTEGELFRTGHAKWITSN